MMIKLANTVKLVTTGGYNCIVVAENSCMSKEELRKILLKHGGEDHGKFCWFKNQQSYNLAKKELTDVGAYVTYFY